MRPPAFEQRCLSLLKLVPGGRVTTYAALADALGSNASRAVGNVMRKNRDYSLPCHRVVCSNGRVGNYNRGARTKARMLRAEGIKIKGGKIDLSVYAYNFRE